MVLFTTRAEINEVFDTFCNTGESNPCDADSYSSKPDAGSNVEEPISEVASIVAPIDPVIRPPSPVQVC